MKNNIHKPEYLVNHQLLYICVTRVPHFFSFAITNRWPPATHIQRKSQGIFIQAVKINDKKSLDLLQHLLFTAKLSQVYKHIACLLFFLF